MAIGCASEINDNKIKGFAIVAKKTDTPRVVDVGGALLQEFGMLGLFRRRCVFGFVGINPDVLKEVLRLYAAVPTVELQAHQDVHGVLAHWQTLPQNTSRAVFLNADDPQFEMNFLHLSSTESKCAVVALAAQQDARGVARLYRMGVKDVVTAPATPLCFVESMRWLMHTTASKGGMGDDWSRRDLTMNLTPKQRLVLDKIVQDKRTSEIAAELNLTDSTVKLHKRNIYMRLKVRSTVGLMHKLYGA
jgi:DNA-binding NarL/FixJ family response regulator